jgi:hypothetical protein
MKTALIRMPTLYALSNQTQDEAVAFSDMTEDALADAYAELREHLQVWLSDNRDLELNDPYVGLCQLLDDWPSPWPYLDVSCLNGLTFAQFHLAWAYGNSEVALATLTQRPQRGHRGLGGVHDDDDAACYAVYAAKALTHAKHLLASKENRLAQAAH